MSTQFKPYRVDFKFTVEETASMYVIAATEKDASDGCLQMLKQNDVQYGDPEIVKVEEYKQNDEASPRLN